MAREICQHINRNSAVQDHVRDHVAAYVIVHVIEIDGVLCSGDGTWRHGHPLQETPWREWYVCPRTGLLQRVSSRKRRKKRECLQKKVPRYVNVSESLQCRIIDGGWHLVALRPFPIVKPQGDEHDVVLNVPVTQLCIAKVHNFYGASVYASHARRLAKREIRQLPIPTEYWP